METIKQQYNTTYITMIRTDDKELDRKKTPIFRKSVKLFTNNKNIKIIKKKVF